MKCFAAWTKQKSCGHFLQPPMYKSLGFILLLSVACLAQVCLRLIWRKLTNYRKPTPLVTNLSHHHLFTHIAPQDGTKPFFQRSNTYYFYSAPILLIFILAILIRLCMNYRRRAHDLEGTLIYIPHSQYGVCIPHLTLENSHPDHKWRPYSCCNARKMAGNGWRWAGPTSDHPFYIHHQQQFWRGAIVCCLPRWLRRRRPTDCTAMLPSLPYRVCEHVVGKESSVPHVQSPGDCKLALCIYGALLLCIIDLISSKCSAMIRKLYLSASMISIRFSKPLRCSSKNCAMLFVSDSLSFSGKAW